MPPITPRDDARTTLDGRTQVHTPRLPRLPQPPFVDGETTDNGGTDIDAEKSRHTRACCLRRATAARKSRSIPSAAYTACCPAIASARARASEIADRSILLARSQMNSKFK